MAFYAMPYRVLFQDTMAYGSHHFLTNFKFQCEVREHFFFSQIIDQNPLDKDLQNLVLLTQEGYSRNLAPVLVGARVGLLLSIEEHTRSSVRMCFRVVHEDGRPVCCGFQSMVCTSKETSGVVLAPPPLLYALAPLREKLRGPSFQERVLAGGAALRSIFDAEAIELGTAVARGTGPRIMPEVLAPPPLYRANAADSKGVVFTFPGQGSWEPLQFEEICRHDPGAKALLEQADEITRRLLGEGVLALVQPRSGAIQATLYRCPDLVQVAAYLVGVLSARYLTSQGVVPHLLVGHSIGELAALAIGGAVDFATGVELVCHRVLALPQAGGTAGGMMALPCGESKARAFVEAAGGESLEVSVLNHDAQTIVSGTTHDLQRLSAVLAGKQLAGVLLKSRYPFHSQLMRDAVAPFTQALKTLAFKPLAIPVYSPLGRGLLSPNSNLPDVLPQHFVQHLVFPTALEDAYALGGRSFIECGGGHVLTSIARRIFRDWPGVTAHAVLGDIAAGELKKLSQMYGRASPSLALAAAPADQHARTASISDAPVAAAPRIPRIASDGSAKVDPRDSALAPMPIAIVSLGCLLPGAANPDALWANLLSGTSGIVDVAQLYPDIAADFRCGLPVQPDKTYSLLNGRVQPEAVAGPVAPYTSGEWAKLPAIARFLAIAMAQCLRELKSALPATEKTCCILGSTGDGSADYDELLLLASAEELVRAGKAPREAREDFLRALQQALGRDLVDAGERSPYRAYQAVVRRFLGDGVRVVAADAACASSLYAIDLGMRALRDGDCDVAVCGGCFAPGVANTCLFAQFQGLSATGSRPLDAGADGVVFGEGAALVVLKRLPDALAAGDAIHGVIRAVGTSSDGKSPSVMEPRQQGQVLAMRRAAARGAVPLATVQYVDAHATGTPVGDAVEFTSLCEAVGPRTAGQNPVRLGSLKALLGHTGWAAGTASVIALCKALGQQTFPPQPNFSAPNPHFALASSPFAIGTEPTTWLANTDGLPRRAGVNGFGFGGCDAHLILEEHNQDYHRTLCAAAAFPPRGGQVAVVGFSVLFPSGDGRVAPEHGGRFGAAEVSLPPGVRILPDVADRMDRGHVLALRAVEKIVSKLPRGWTDLRADTGVIVGFTGKSRCGIDASMRIYFDHLLRRLAELRPADQAGGEGFDLARSDFIAAVQGIAPSGPYTLPGLMPNVMAGRVANAFHLTGPNMVLDAGEASLLEAAREAERLLRIGECQLVFAGGISSCAGRDVDRFLQACSQPDPRPTGEAAIMLALMAPATARAKGMQVMAYLSLSTDGAEVPHSKVRRAGATWPFRLLGAEGAFELAGAMDLVQSEGGSATLLWSDPTNPKPIGLTISRENNETPSASTARGKELPTTPNRKAEKLPPEAASLLETPIRWTAPRWLREDLRQSDRQSRPNWRRALILTDQPAWCISPDVAATLSKLQSRLVCPASTALPGAIAVDLASSSAMERSLEQLNDVPYEAVLVLKDLAEIDPLESVTAAGQCVGNLLELLFAVARHAYARLEKGEVCVGAVCLHGVSASDVLHPYTGLVSGFMRSLARELPRAVCKQVNVPGGVLAEALSLLDAELNQRAPKSPCEVSYLHGARHVSALVALDAPVTGEPLLSKDSVVVAVGGARGITAVLAEALLRRFACSLVLLGRTDPDAVPADLLALDDETFERFEPEFYRRQLAGGATARVPQLKQLYDSYRSGREVAANLQTLQALAGRVYYARVDVTDEAAVDAALKRIAADHGRLDMVLHGAGIQTSKQLARKKLEEFRAILDTKLIGLGNLMRACRRHFAGQRIHFHPVTSSFSQIGNAGQQDYGAANVAMDRVAAHLANGAGPWHASSLGWLGWYKVGMTRGSEYATLAIARRLRPIPRAEGGALFTRFLSGRPAAPTLHLMSELEVQAFDLDVRPERPARPAVTVRPDMERTLRLAPETHPFLNEHLLEGVATMPGAFAVELAVRAAQELRPGLHVQCLRGISIERFIKFPDGRPFHLRVAAAILDEDSLSTRIGMRFLSDFVHANGQVLQKDIVHFSAEILLGPAPKPIASRDDSGTVGDGWHLPDPYLHPAGPLLLDGCFRSLHGIEIGKTHSTAIFRPAASSAPQAIADALIPFVLLDAVWRFAAIRREEDGMAVLCVPLRCGRLDVLAGVNQQSLGDQECHLTCSAPRLEGEHVLVDWAEAVDASGRALFAVHDIVGRVYGMVPAQAEALPSRQAAGRPSAANGVSGRASRSAANEKPLAGKVALVTGSGRGIGKVIALRLCELGAQVIVNSFHSRDKGEQTTAEAIARGGKAIHLWGSVANAAHLRRIFQEIDTHCGGLDYFVSNASAGVFAPLQYVTPEYWDVCFRTNVTALHQGALFAAERMRRRGGGKIIALSSVGSQLCFDYFGCVGAVKAAVECLVRYLAVELAPEGIQVNTVTVGPVRGELLNGFPGRPRWENLVPRRELIEEDEVVAPILYLLASEGTSGTSLILDAAGSLRLCEPVLVEQSVQGG